ncbi:5-dehydro-4-deoxy-D-glucuronate isomerase [Aquirufa ecclesiirivi]|uniref:4-deoxy-L-threo-5-hexosulose-uronate ketol-isomerase n=1 Tax=Aquirufa ecclesiirivi TaxID=2715124 RepID=A0ABT4JCI5_9BACT|nr:5-dehydro-4-deoxy-D-glucuronate isomerase [Aquirufa ecclesiirivi]MCZ2474010.1 5-dehydro-4-deoxy-D-glucuronate isomerase [Aquirufa ecclesiirivi]MDF0694021.1 5-dehydro-4-deoxy-D-glucuronate isomerase [Aquirufa ecclesiirivi]
MNYRFEASRKEVSTFTNQELRDHFLVEHIFEANQIHLTYSIYDRMIIGGVMPVLGEIKLPNPEKLKANYFLERRELGIINVGGPGIVKADGQSFEISKLSAVYLGKGTQDVHFSSISADEPAQFYLLSSPAHASYPNEKLDRENVVTVNVGTLENSNHRTIYKYIHNDGIQSCQLVMGLTILEPGSIWNTMPAHVHDRRMEAYLYFDVKPGQAVLHLMGETKETKHIWVQNHQAVISPPWSIHSGAGTQNYSFIWGMAGENKDYTDMDFSEITELR